MSTPTKTGVDGGGGGDADGGFDLTPGLDKLLQFSLILSVCGTNRSIAEGK